MITVFRNCATSTTLAGATIAAILMTPLAVTKAEAGAEPFIGEVMLVGYTFCPRGWANADGALLPISANTALFSLYGTTFGGDGRTTFALPDLRGRVPVSVGQGPGLSSRTMGQQIGTEANTLSANNMPAHNHGVTATVSGNSAPGTSPSPAGGVPALSAGGTIYGPTPNAPMNPDMVAVTQNTIGGGAPVNNVPPTLVMRYCVALQGIFPSRN